MRCVYEAVSLGKNAGSELKEQAASGYECHMGVSLGKNAGSGLKVWKTSIFALDRRLFHSAKMPGLN